jgi:hypothetical protein
MGCSSFADLSTLSETTVVRLSVFQREKTKYGHCIDRALLEYPQFFIFDKFQLQIKAPIILAFF